ncbi:MAG: UDP-N-acetylglucosamine 2-epimerase (non-hydrolyzing) [Gammaproteobacteria bacterium TMED95]|uniref:UDP-N-acetylglucosamine 2-epimerase (non-hydrolyzing) n=1 Tax=Alteromonas mediterranea TaxID=314275 RepID=A0AAC9NT11_9ALTE|nr:UDP-N-acetylglucosamine 2-epimerase (non-hydrolyzing) [Alteromonas mediterranea]APD92385.1 UDP-N-acetylglucosamine 2-epimerase [Alteromonas mediterranea]APE00246.1 UDP-N-acetylglucosamine 2-epimerase [Alteromonas mediterranea]OUV22172.1 MAG: UDP-N-acetylglucosamine 2-epimerase (non-hydrolyzing) [Gammaproteobacteria bacterium TMED95]|tara:strand:- start:7362 stop:8516 length:1155 start_codon:yes stop_codon:yes gene_type:complete
MLNTPLSVWVVFGTRPEAIKMLPLVRAMKEDSRFDVTVCITAQHREMLDQVMRVFDVKADIDLDVMRENQSLPELSSRIITGLDFALKSADKKPDYLLVHGDTATTLSAALGAYFHQIPVGHVEAGLRTNNIYSPFPEEGNRKMTGAISTLHFAPTSKAESALLREGVSPEFISVTGNTVIDALKWVVEQLEITPSLAGETEGFISNIKQKYSRYILVTGHRRENHGDGFKRICQALRTIASQNPDTAIIYPVHPNPKVLKPVTDELGQLDNISLISPQEYAPFVSLMKNAYLILTDSGGVQEEAPSLGIPVLVMRDTTEREEAVEAGTVRLVGTDSEKIINEATILLNDPVAYDAMAGKKNPYGDGQACNRILSVLIEHFSNQ